MTFLNLFNCDCILLLHLCEADRVERVYILQTDLQV